MEKTAEQLSQELTIVIKERDELAVLLSAEARKLQDAEDDLVVASHRKQNLEAVSSAALKVQVQLNRQIEAMAAQLKARDEEIALLKVRKADRLDLMASAAIQPLGVRADLPPEPDQQAA